MSEETKKNEIAEDEQKKNFSVTIPEDDFIDDIPAPESDVPADGNPHKVVRYVDNTPKTEKSEKKKGNIVGEFFAGAAAGAKTVGEGISAGIKTISEKKPKTEKSEEAREPKIEEPDETQFPKEEKSGESPLSAIKAKLDSLPTAAVIGGAIGILVVLIAIILLIATSCSSSGRTPSDPDKPGNEIVIGENTSSGSEENPEENTALEIPDRKDRFAEAFNANNDVVAWLYIPGLKDVDAGVCFSYDKTYPYNKRDITGKKVPNSYWITGAYYTHFRNLFGDTSAELSTNTVIFGHSDLGKENLAYSNDDPNGPLFSQLFSFKDPSFAEKTPYIYLTLPEENTVWEIFAVFYNDSKATNSTFSSYYNKNAGDLWYIEPSPGQEEFKLMLETMKKRSIYDYDVDVTNGDQILTLSTCTVAYGLQARDNYRFVIVAKLVTNTEDLVVKNASFTINKDAPVPDTYKDEFNEYISTWKPSEN